MALLEELTPLILPFDTFLGVDLNSGESVTIDEAMIQGFDTIEFFQPGKGTVDLVKV